MAETRGRISDKRLGELDDQIAMQNQIMREVQSFMVDLDPDTLAHVLRRLTRIMKAAEKTKAALIETREREKREAADGRNG